MNYPRIIAHRCGGALAPENSLVGLGIAARLGCRGVEFDVMLSADGVPLLIHDETLDRTTTGSGRVAELSAHQIRQFDANSRHHKAYGGEAGNSQSNALRLGSASDVQSRHSTPIPTLEEAMEHIERLGLWANIEIKPATGFETATGITVGRWLARHWNGQGVISSFAQDAVLAAMHETQPQRPEFRYAALFEKLPADWSSVLARTSADGVHLAATHVTSREADELNTLGVQWACYTVNSLHEAERLFALGCKAIFTDRPDLWRASEM